MKSTTIVAISLVLFALVIILSAAIIFETVEGGRYKVADEATRTNQATVQASQGEDISELLTLERSARSEAEDAQKTVTVIVSDLQALEGTSTADFSDMSEKQAAADATRVSEHATAEAVNKQLGSDIVAMTRTIDAQAVSITEHQMAIATITGRVQFIENQEPRVKLIEPEGEIKIELSESVKILLVASHPIEISDIEITENSFPIEGCVKEIDGSFAIIECNWQPSQTGEFNLVAFARSKDKVSQEHSQTIKVTVVEGEESTTPENEE